MSRTIMVFVAALLPCPALACSLCGGDLQTRATIRQEVEKAKIVVAGTLSNPRLNSASPDGGTTDLVIEQILKDHFTLKGKTQLTLSRYLPTEDKTPKFLLMADIADGKLDSLSGRYVKDERIFDYVKAILKLNEADGAKRLAFFFQYLDSPVPEIADDAYLEFAKSTDTDVGRAAKALDPDRLRRLVGDAKTPGNHLGMFAFLLGCCGNDSDADLLLLRIKADTEQTRSALRGLIAGYVELRPKAGWELAARIVNDPKCNFLDRYAALGVARFFQNLKPAESRTQILRIMTAGIGQGDLAEIPIEDLRRWGWWDLTDTVLGQFNKKTHDFPMVRLAIMRYALACPKPEAVKFVAEMRKRDPKFVAEVEESLEP
jgi:hypothetical protein